MQIEALFGAQSKFINNNALQLFSKINCSIFLFAVAKNLLEKCSRFWQTNKRNTTASLMTGETSFRVHPLKFVAAKP